MRPPTPPTRPPIPIPPPPTAILDLQTTLAHRTCFTAMSPHRNLRNTRDQTHIRHTHPSSTLGRPSLSSINKWSRRPFNRPPSHTIIVRGDSRKSRRGIPFYSFSPSSSTSSILLRLAFTSPHSWPTSTRGGRSAIPYSLLSSCLPWRLLWSRSHGPTCQWKGQWSGSLRR